MNVTADWYDEHTDGGSDFLGALDETIEDIAAAPWRWPLVKGMTPPTRRRLMKRYPYSVSIASTIAASSSSRSHTKAASTSTGSGADC